MKAGFFLLLLSLSGCAGSPQPRVAQAELDYQRADVRIRTVEEFEQRQRACAQAGGILRVPRGSDARQPTRPRDLRRALCERRGDFSGVY